MRTGIAPDATPSLPPEARLRPAGAAGAPVGRNLDRRRPAARDAAVPAGSGEPAVAELLVRRQGVLPIASVADLAAVDDAFESDEEFEAFLPTSASRRRAQVSLVIVDDGLASAILD